MIITVMESARAREREKFGLLIIESVRAAMVSSAVAEMEEEQN